MKLAYTLSISLVRLQEVYSVNMLQTLKGIRGRLLYARTLVKALTHIGMLILLQVAEALNTRYPVITVKREENAGRNLPPIVKLVPVGLLLAMALDASRSAYWSCRSIYYVSNTCLSMDDE